MNRSPSWFSPRVRLLIWGIFAAFLWGGSLVWFYLLRGERILDHDKILIGGWIVLGMILLVLFLLLRTTPSDAIRLPQWISIWIIAGGAAILQAAAVFMLMPALSEDVLRYRLDGRTWRAGKSPYAITPQNFSGRDSLDAIAPFQHLHTIYPPASQLYFIVLSHFESTTSTETETDWRHTLPRLGFGARALSWRITSAMLCICATMILLSLLRSRRASPWNAILFAWNPLVIMETAGMAHQDILGVSLLLGMVWLLERNRAALAAGTLAVAMGVKPLAMLLLPAVLTNGSGTGWKSAVRMLGTFVIVLLVLCIPMMAYEHGYRGWLDTARELAQRWEANGSVYELVKHLFGQDLTGVAMEHAKTIGRRIAIVTPVVMVLILLLRRVTIESSGYWIYLVTAMVSPVAYPWYLLWVLCFVPLLRGAGGLTALLWSSLIGLSYLLWRTPDWILPGKILLMEYVPVYMALLIELGWARLLPSRSAQ